MLKRLALAMGLSLAAAPAWAGCQDIEYKGTPYTICEVTAGEDLRLYHADAGGAVLGSFSAVDAQLRGEGKRLGFAMNAGMYHSDRAPVGLLVTEGRERAPIVTSDGPGNFGLLPNGVFCIGKGRFAVVESRRFAKKPPVCQFATQSGPMLVIDGKLHPRFLPTSDSRFVRNGVGVSADGQRAIFAISGRPVNFTEFGQLFRDRLDVPQALYFDGKISRLYAPALNRDDFGFQMGPIVGLAVPG